MPISCRYGARHTPVWIQERQTAKTGQRLERISANSHGLCGSGALVRTFDSVGLVSELAQDRTRQHTGTGNSSDLDCQLGCMTRPANTLTDSRNARAMITPASVFIRPKTITPNTHPSKLSKYTGRRPYLSPRYPKTGPESVAVTKCTASYTSQPIHMYWSVRAGLTAAALHLPTSSSFTPMPWTISLMYGRTTLNIMPSAIRLRQSAMMGE